MVSLATDSWKFHEFEICLAWIFAFVTQIETVDMNDPFQDISIGGYDIPGQMEGFLVVWGITFHGKVC